MGEGLVIDLSAEIHASAYVAGQYPVEMVFDGRGALYEPGECAIGARTKVWHHAHVRSGARIGADCVIGKGVYVDTGVIIGDRCKLQNGVNIYNGVTLGDEVFVGPGAIFTNDKNPRAVGEWTIVPTKVGNGVSIGAGAVIVCGITIGDGAMIGAGAVVTHNVLPGSTVVGNPAYHLRPAGGF